MQIKLSYVVVFAYIAHNIMDITLPNLTEITNQTVCHSFNFFNIIDVPSPIGLICSVKTNAPLVAACRGQPHR